MEDEARSHAERARDVAGSFSGSRGNNGDTDITQPSDQSGSRDRERSTTSQKQRSLRNPMPADEDTSTGTQSSTDLRDPSLVTRDNSVLSVTGLSTGRSVKSDGSHLAVLGGMLTST
jgi:hypothetical protein